MQNQEKPKKQKHRKNEIVPLEEASNSASLQLSSSVPPSDNEDQTPESVCMQQIKQIKKAVEIERQRYIRWDNSRHKYMNDEPKLDYIVCLNEETEEKFLGKLQARRNFKNLIIRVIIMNRIKAAQETPEIWNLIKNLKKYIAEEEGLEYCDAEEGLEEVDEQTKVQVVRAREFKNYLTSAEFEIRLDYVEKMVKTSESMYERLTQNQEDLSAEYNQILAHIQSIFNKLTRSKQETPKDSDQDILANMEWENEDVQELIPRIQHVQEQPYISENIEEEKHFALEQTANEDEHKNFSESIFPEQSSDFTNTSKLNKSSYAHPQQIQHITRDSTTEEEEKSLVFQLGQHGTMQEQCGVQRLQLDPQEIERARSSSPRGAGKLKKQKKRRFRRW